jgi:hypothetical protein
MRYAANVCDLAGAVARPELERALLEYLARGVSNDAAVGTGRDVYQRHAVHRLSADVRTAAGIAAANALGVDARSVVPRAHDVVPRAYDIVALDAASVTLRVVRTGRTSQLHVDATSVSPESFALSVLVTPAGGTAERVQLSDFPERARGAIRATLRHKLLGRSLTPEELAALASGDMTLRDLAARALVRAIEAVPKDVSGAALRHAHSVLDLLDQLETPVPFDAQAAWWHVHTQMPNGDRRAELATLGTRLGFDIAVLTAAGATT